MKTVAGGLMIIIIEGILITVAGQTLQERYMAANLGKLPTD
jgi:hypothetical protein